MLLLLRFLPRRRCISTGASLQEANPVVSPSSSDSTSPTGEYTVLRDKLLSRAKKGSGFLAVYIFLQQGLVVSFFCDLIYDIYAV